METTIGPTVGEALVALRKASGLTGDDALDPTWTCRLGPVTLRLPNFGWRRRAILAHDLHHVLTGYPCTMRGEFQMAAWEFGAGPMPHWGAALFCLPLVLAGLLWAPSRMLRAFLRGRRSRSLHRSSAIERLLATPLHVARADFATTAQTRSTLADHARFVCLVLKSSVISLWPMALLVGLWIGLAG